MPRHSKVILPGYTYVDMNMVRAGVVGHPADWDWCGYREVAALRERYRILEFERLVDKMEARDIAEVREAYCGLIERRAEAEHFVRESRWTEPVAVGSESFVREVAGRLGRRSIEVGPVEEHEQSTWRAQGGGRPVTRDLGGGIIASEPSERPINIRNHSWSNEM